MGNNNYSPIKGNKEIKYDIFSNILRTTQEELFEITKTFLSIFYQDLIVEENKYIYAKGSDLILTAHLDTVFEKTPKDIYINEENKKIYYYSPQGIGGDDRCGIYIILNLVKKLKEKPTILLFCDEEKGGIGSKMFAKTKYNKELNGKYILEIDRKGTGVVFYDEENKDFIKDILDITKREKETGSFSDIKNLYDNKIASCNLGCGYYNAHTKNEYICLNDVDKCIKDIININKNMTKFYEHKETLKTLDEYQWEKYKTKKQYKYNNLEELIWR